MKRAPFILILIAGLLALLTYSCSNESQAVPTVTKESVENETPTATDESEAVEKSPVPTVTAIIKQTEETEPKITYLSTKLGSLCSGANTTVEYEIEGLEENEYKLSWKAKFGTLTENGDKVVYTAPPDLPDESFDVIQLEILDDDFSIAATTSIRFIDAKDTKTWQTTNGPNGGRISSIEINRSNPDELFVSAGGGVYKSINAGESWELIGDFLEPGKIPRQILLNQNDPDIIYANSGGSGTLYKSGDGGRSFAKIYEPETGISHVAMSPSNPDLLLVGTRGGQVFSSTNGGVSWSNLALPTTSNSTVQAIAITQENHYWVGTIEWTDYEDGQVFHTTDGGKTWKLINNMEPYPETNVHSIVIDPKDPHTVYVGLMHSENKSFEGNNPRVLLKTKNEGNDWEAVHFPELWDNAIKLLEMSQNNQTLYTSGVGGGYWFYQIRGGGTAFNKIELPRRTGIDDVAVNPQDPDIFYLATGTGILKTIDGGKSFEWKHKGIRATSLSLLETERGAGNGTVFATSAGGEGVYRSFNYGESWEQVTENGLNHPWGDEIQINPHDPDEVWFVADIGQVDMSEDNGDWWDLVVDKDGDGFRFSSIYAIAAAKSNPGRLYALKNGFGIFRFDDWIYSPHSTHFLHHSEVDYSLSMDVHPEDDDVIVSGYIPKPFQDFAWVRLSHDGGRNWETLSRIKGSDGITSVAFSSASPDLLYFSSVGSKPAIYRSENFGDRIEKLTSPWNLAQVKGKNIQYIEVLPHPNQPDALYVSAYPVGVFQSNDGGESWQSIDDGLPAYEVQDPLRQGRYNLTLSSLNPETMYVGIYGHGVYKKMDKEESWQSAGSIPDNRILALTVHPTDDEIIYVGTKQGVYFSADGGETWVDYDQGMGNIGVRTFAWGRSNTLIAGTLGYGNYTLESDENQWKQMPGLGEFGTFWPIWNDRPLYQYTSLIFHPEDPNTIVFGTFPSGVYISQDGGESWHESNTGWTWDGVFSFAYHPENSDILYAGTYNGVNRSLDGGKTWEMWDEGWPDEQWVFSIDFDPQDPNVMYACAKNGENEGRGQPGFFMGSVMKSTDGGESWFEIMRGIPKDQEYYKIIVDPYTPDVVYLVSQREGIYISYTGGEKWELWNKGLTNHRAGTNGNNVTETMAISPDGLYLYFASDGSGVFRRMTVNAEEKCGCGP